MNRLIKVFENFEEYDTNKQRAIKCAIGKLVANLCAVKDRNFVKWSFVKVLNKIKHTVEKDFEEQRKHLQKAVADINDIVNAKQVIRCAMKDAVNYAEFKDIQEKLKSAYQPRYRNIVNILGGKQYFIDPSLDKIVYVCEDDEGFFYFKSESVATGSSLSCNYIDAKKPDMTPKTAMLK